VKDSRYGVTERGLVPVFELMSAYSVSDMRGLGERRGSWRERRVSDMRGLGERRGEGGGERGE
jgi:hypothetical protein